MLFDLQPPAGKSGHVAGRLAASLSSIGVAAEYVHASEWSHGDLGGFMADRYLTSAACVCVCVCVLL